MRGKSEQAIALGGNKCVARCENVQVSQHKTFAGGDQVLRRFGGIRVKFHDHIE